MKKIKQGIFLKVYVVQFGGKSRGKIIWKTSTSDIYVEATNLEEFGVPEYMALSRDPNLPDTGHVTTSVTHEDRAVSNQ